MIDNHYENPCLRIRHYGCITTRFPRAGLRVGMVGLAHVLDLPHSTGLFAINTPDTLAPRFRNHRKNPEAHHKAITSKSHRQVASSGRIELHPHAMHDNRTVRRVALCTQRMVKELQRAGVSYLRV